MTFESRLNQLRGAYLASSASRLEEMGELLARLEVFPGDREALTLLMRDFHAFAGTGATYGFPALSDLGGQGEEETETRLREGGSVGAEELARWSAAAAELRAALDAGVPAAEPAPASPAAQASRAGEAPRRLLLGGAEASSWTALQASLAAEGIEASWLPDRTSLVEGLAAGCAEGLLVELPLSDGSGKDLIAELRALPGDLPLLVVGERSSFAEKLGVLRAGADAFFEKPLDPREVVRRLLHILERSRPETPRVLSVEDDPNHAELIRAVLEAGGFSVRNCADPAEFETLLAATRPDLLLLDVLLPGASGYDLARFTRQHRHFASLPIVFLTTATQMKDRIRGLGAGGDDYLTKPLQPSLLLATVSARVERARFLKSLIDRDGLTHLLTHTAFTERAKAIFARRRHQPQRPVAFAMLDLDHFKRVNDTYGHPTGDRVLAALASLLRSKLRFSDALGRYGGEEFALILEDIRGEDAQRLLEGLLQEFSAQDHAAPDGSSFRVSFSAGIATLADHGQDFEGWREASDAALYRAKGLGRGRVFLSSGEA